MGLVQAAPSSSRVESLDILRGLMALAVAVYHLSIWTQLFDSGTELNRLVALLGNYGVEGFFIISGFCFFHIYGETTWNRQALQSFHIKRFFRIAPLYYVAVLLNLILGQARGPDPSARMLVENFTLTFGLFHPNHALVLGGWSIGIEYVFYMAFPLLAWATRRKAVLYLATLALIALAVPWSFYKVQAASMIGHTKFHTYVQIPNHAFLFFFGGLAAHIRSMTPKRLHWRLFLGLGILLLLTAWWQLPQFYDHFDILTGFYRARFAGLSALVVLLFAFFEVPEGRYKRPLTLLGDWSYSVYLMHPFASQALVHTLPTSIPAPWIFLGSLALTLGLAALTHTWIEKPAMALGRRWAADLAKSPRTGHSE
ncbi:MAG: hypothetical protein H6Q00_3476 [Holophagaceae bacterium]|nr:hypothetical protein [Holophagaceae bacterium]